MTTCLSEKTKKIILFVFIMAMFVNCTAPKNISYVFEKPVTDSLQKGIDYYVKLLHKKQIKLKLCAVVIDNGNGCEIFLQDYSAFPQNGLLNIIKATNRQIIVDSHTKIPVSIPADKMSIQIQKDKMAAIPLAGYYIKVVIENHQQKVIQTSILF